MKTPKKLSGGTVMDDRARLVEEIEMAFSRGFGNLNEVLETLESYRYLGAFRYTHNPRVAKGFNPVTGRPENSIDGMPVVAWVTEHLTEEKEDVLKKEAIKLAEYYLRHFTYKTENHGDVILREGEIAKNFLEKYRE